MAGGAATDNLDWKAIAQGAPALVIYMALKHLGIITERLMANGRSPLEPVAIISKASTAEQAVLETTLGAAVADLKSSGLEPPAVVVIGEVVRLRAGLDWLGALSGRILEQNPLGTPSKSRSA